MSDEVKMAGMLIGALLSAFLSVVIAMSFSGRRETEIAKVAIEAGLVQGRLPDRVGTYWVKPSQGCGCE